MKKHCKLFLVLGVLVFAIAVCKRDEDANAPDLIEPADGAVFSSESPTFIWSSQPFADGYTIVINDDSSMTGDTIISKDDLPDTTYTMSGSDFDGLENGTYYWTAAAYDDPADGSARLYYWDEVRSFIVEKADTSSPTAPDLIEPADGAVFSSEPPTFIWNSQPFADGYIIVINDDSSMTGDTVFSQDLYDTTYTMSGSDFDGLENTTYYWTAAAYDDPADGSARLYYWDEERSFVVAKPEFL